MAVFQCLPGEDGYLETGSAKKRNDFHIRGTSLGGWLVLEPWITPSLFYQFLGLTEKYGEDAYRHIAIDSKTFCTALGKEEANRQLRQHWRKWVDEQQIAKLARAGVETLRIPLGDWMFMPYEPYIGCWDGALDELDRVLRLCYEYNLTALLDIHAMRMSQNGLDNSGDTGSFEWLGEGPAGHTLASVSSQIVSHYRHWDIRGGNWAGEFNLTSQAYSSVNRTNIEDSLKTVHAIVERYKHNEAVIGLTPVNEPWWNIPMEVLKEYYWKSYKIVQKSVPHWITLMHDSFRLSPESWGSPWMQNCDNWAMDTHLYQAWADTAPSQYFVDVSCASIREQNLALMESIGVPVVVGEWSLATDNCAMWLNGLNDNVPGYPKHDCTFAPCPASYMGPEPTFAVPNNSVNTFDPMGAGGPSYVINGKCPRDAPFPDEIGEVKSIAYAKLYAYDRQTHGNFYWNFRTEFDSRWDYQVAIQNEWIPRDWSPDSSVMRAIIGSCEDSLTQPRVQTSLFANRAGKGAAIFFVSAFFLVVLVRVLNLGSIKGAWNRRFYRSIPSVSVELAAESKSNDIAGYRPINCIQSTHKVCDDCT